MIISSIVLTTVLVRRIMVVNDILPSPNVSHVPEPSLSTMGTISKDVPSTDRASSRLKFRSTTSVVPIQSVRTVSTETIWDAVG